MQEPQRHWPAPRDWFQGLLGPVALAVVTYLSWHNVLVSVLIIVLGIVGLLVLHRWWVRRGWHNVADMFDGLRGGKRDSDES